MKILSPTVHGALDLVVVVVFALAPSVLGLEGGAAVLAYALAVVHLAMTLVTGGLPMARSNLVPLSAHGLVEAAVGVVLALLGMFAFDDEAGWFYVVMGLLILVVFSISRYQPGE